MDGWVWLLCSPLVLAGAILLVGSTRVIWKGCRAASWPHTTATLLDSELKQYEGSGDDAVTSWEVRVRYEYWVGGRRYEGTRIHAAYGASSGWKPHHELSQRLRPSRRVRVYYNGSDPAESALSVGFYSISLAVSFAGLLFATLGAGIPLSYYSVLHHGFVLVAIGLALLPAFYFAVAGRDRFALGIRLVAQRPGVRGKQSTIGRAR
jgi:hypothetical protein